MSLILPKTCSMGSSKTGLVGTIGVALLNPDGTVHTARTTAGIYEIGGGCYGKEITFDDNWKGSILWDTGGGSPVYATEDYDVEGMIDMIEEDTSKMHFAGDDIKATLDGEKVVLTDATEAQIDAIETDTNEIQGKLPTNNIMGSSIKTDKDDEIDAIKAQTDKLQFAVDNDIKATLDGEKVVLTDATEAQIDAIESDLNTPDQYKADVSALALEDGGRLQNVETDTNEIQGKLPDDKIAGSIDATSLESKHGVLSWESATSANIAAAVWNALHTDYQLSGSMGEYMTKIYNAAKKVFMHGGKV